MLNSMQIDVLSEMVNVYIGMGASYLSEMARQRVLLTVPEIQVLEFSQGDEFSGIISSVFPGHIISSSMAFGQVFKGKAFLIFPTEQAKLLVNACLGENPVLEDGRENTEFIDTDFDVLKEISNVILNAIIGGFGNFLDIKLEYSLPDIEMIYVSQIGQQLLLKDSLYILILHTNFMLDETKIKGVIMIALSMSSIYCLEKKINELLEDY